MCVVEWMDGKWLLADRRNASVQEEPRCGHIVFVRAGLNAKKDTNLCIDLCAHEKKRTTTER